MHERIYLKDSSGLEFIFKNPYNPPCFTKDFSEYEFSIEYQKVFEEVKNALDKVAIAVRCDDGYFMSEQSGGGRMISIELDDLALLAPQLLDLIELVMDGVTVDYFTHISWGDLSVQPFQIAVFKGKTYGWGAISSLERIGF